MGEENKCYGLDCAICAETKCLNEKTIINGIDVNECEHHYTNTVNGIIYNGCAIYEQINELGYSQDTLCEQNPNCYFKQLKRLQEENENLKYEIDRHKDTICYLNDYDMCLKTLIRYKQTLEKIKKWAKEIYK